MNWDDVRHFLALARLGSVRGAGASLGVSHSTVGRRVAALEADLGTRLFDRHRDGWQLTAEGQELLPRAEHVEREMCALERQAEGRDGSFEGPVRLTTCDTWVSGLLMPALIALGDAHPGLELCIEADPRPFDLSRREADLAIRMLRRGDLPPEHLMGVRLSAMALGNFVSIEQGSRRDPEVEGSEPRWLGYQDTRLFEFLVSGGSYPDLPVWGAFASLHLQAQAASHGLGCAILPCYVGDSHPGLRRLASPDVRHLADVWLLCHPDLRRNARLKATRACIVQAFAGLQDLFGGARPRRTAEA